MVNCISQEYKDMLLSMLDQHIENAVISAFLSVVPSCEKVKAEPQPVVAELEAKVAPEVTKPRGAIAIEGQYVWLRGAYANRYKTIQQLEIAKTKEAARWEASNPRLAQKVKEMPMLEWLSSGGAISRKVVIPKAEAVTPTAPAQLQPPAPRPAALIQEGEQLVQQTESPLTAISLFQDKLGKTTARNSLNAERELDKLEEQGVDVSEARELLDNYKDIERSDYDSAEEFGEARTEAWEEFVEAVNDLAAPEVEGD